MLENQKKITFQQLFAGQFAPAYQRNAWALKRLTSKLTHNPKSPLRYSVTLQSDSEETNP